MYHAVEKCRICGNSNLIPVLELGHQALTGVFPKNRETSITKGPLTLVKCTGNNCCGLLQLAHSYSLSEMYGENYGYRSGLNPSMVAHLKSKVERIKKYGILKDGDIVVDIGSNDATTLKQYQLPDCRLVGIDPTGEKFTDFYTSNIELIADFFSASAYKRLIGKSKAKVVTSFSMFYDLEDPISFMLEVAEILDDEGIWVFEQSYMPAMLATNSYDTICHEHLEYYSLAQILWMVERVGLRVVDVETNEVNGGSFSVVVQKVCGSMQPTPAVSAMKAAEQLMNLDLLQTYFEFGQRVQQSKRDLLEFLHDARKNGRRVAGLGASTKGNVLLQFCNIDSSLLYAIGEVNPDKFGSFTPGTLLNIVDEQEILNNPPDHVLVLPWHFRSFFESQSRYASLNFVYPLPMLSSK
jgi:NDP-4-keto-2,6-dideoxyhexose 3-C-methyltransferase